MAGERTGRRRTDKETQELLDELQQVSRDLRAWKRLSQRRWRIWRVLWTASLLVSAFAWYRAEDGRHDAIREVQAQARAANVRAVQAKAQTHDSCERSRIFGPALADAYAKYHILKPRELQAYRDGLPKSCP